MDVRAAIARQATRREEAVHERLQAIGLADDHLRVFGELRGQLRVVELSLQELRGPANAAERILDLVREAADEVAVGLLLLEQPLLAGHLQLLVDVAELDQQHRIADLDGGYRAGEMQLGLADRAELDLLLGVRRAPQERLVDRAAQARAVGEQIRGRVPDEFLPRQLEEVLGGRIHVGHAFVGAQHEHRGGQQLEARVARRMRRSRRRKEAQLHGSRRAHERPHAASGEILSKFRADA